MRSHQHRATCITSVDFFFLSEALWGSSVDLQPSFQNVSTASVSDSQLLKALLALNCHRLWSLSFFLSSFRFIYLFIYFTSEN